MYSSLDEVIERVKSVGGDKEARLNELRIIESEIVAKSEALAIRNLPYMHLINLAREIIAREDEIVAQTEPTPEPVIEVPVEETPVEKSVEEVVSEEMVSEDSPAEPAVEEAPKPKARKSRAKKASIE